MKTPKELSDKEKGEVVKKDAINLAIDDVIENAIKDKRITSKGGTFWCNSRDLYKGVKETQTYFLQCGWYADIIDKWNGTYEVKIMPYSSGDAKLI